MTAERPRVIGGSDIAGLLGLSKYQNAVDIYARLVHGVARKQTRPMGHGLEAEPALLESYRQHIGEADLCDFIQHRELDWCGGHIDALSEDCVIDFKTCNVWGAKNYGTPGTDEVHADVVAQLNWYCWLTKRQRWHVYVGFVENSPDGFSFVGCALYAGDFDAELHEMSMASAIDFRENYWLKRIWPSGAPLENKRIIKSLRAS